MTVKNMHSDLDISLFQVKNWEEILGEEFYMTNPLVRYILLAILLLVLLSGFGPPASGPSRG